MKADAEVYTGRTKDAVDYVEAVINILRSPSIAGLITYETPVRSFAAI